MKPVAVVTPWFGKELKGGAEQHAYQLATRMAKKKMKTTVLTTCSKNFLSDWSDNYFQPGEYKEDELDVIRFPLEKRNGNLFDKINKKLLSKHKGDLRPHVSPLNKAEEQIYLYDNIYSQKLIKYLYDNYNDYSAFLFLPYLFPSTIKGVEKVTDKAILIPCLHDEPYAYLDCVGNTFCCASKICYLSEGEYEVSKKLFGESIIAKSKVVGAGVEIRYELVEEHTSAPYVKGDYILYLGKKDKGKNVHVLIEAFEKFLKRVNSKMKLILAGPFELPTDINIHSKQIIDVGMVEEEEKINLLKHCKALVNFSENESFSRVIFEAWFSKKPVVINRNCVSTYKALKSAGFAGWSAGDVDSLVDIFKEIEDSTAESLEELGQRGYDYARSFVDWDKIIDKYILEIQQIERENGDGKGSIKLRSRRGKIAGKNDIKVIIVYKGIYRYDAVGNDIMGEYEVLKRNGIEVYLYAEDCSNLYEDYILDEKKLYRMIQDENNILIYHHANFWEKGEVIISKALCRKWMKYHNITPSSFFESYSDVVSSECINGREQTKRMIENDYFDSYVADSEYNARELKEHVPEIEKIHILPPFNRIMDYEDAEINLEILEELSKNKVNAVFVGRISPNKGHKHLIEVIKEYINLFDEDICLNIIGGLDSNLMDYYDELLHLIKINDLSNKIFFRNHLSLNDIYTYYIASDVFLLMSEHEGFCVPILEAQYNCIPVVALDRTAVKDTLGIEQLIFQSPNYQEIASAIHVIVNSRKIKQYLTDKGYDNYEKYNISNLSNDFIQLVDNLAI